MMFSLVLKKFDMMEGGNVTTGRRVKKDETGPPKHYFSHFPKRNWLSLGDFLLCWWEMLQKTAAYVTVLFVVLVYPKREAVNIAIYPIVFLIN